MNWRHGERHPALVRLPSEKAIDKLPLGRNFCRPHMSPVIKQSGKNDRLERDLQILRQIWKPAELKVGERGNEVEVPRRLGHCLARFYRS